MAPHPAPRAPRSSTWTRNLILVVCLTMGAVLGVRWWLHVRVRVSTDNAFVEGHVAYLSPRVAGNVLEVRVQDNQHVRAGDVPGVGDRLGVSSSCRS